MVSNPLLNAALAYARLGWRVVWLHHPQPGGGCTCGKDCGTSAGKHPRLPKWTQSASSDEDQVARWWHDAPASNVGVALGSGSGIVAVDVDPPHGEEFLIEISGGDLPETLTLTTGKGRSLLYAIPDGLEVEPRTVGFKDAGGQETIRLQSTGAQRVMPPSLHPLGRHYAWVPGRGPDEIEIAPMPAWMIVEMTVPKDARWADPTTHGPADAYAPGADFNRRASWTELLTNHGFRPAGGRGDVLYFTRPGKTAGVSVTVGHFKAKDGTPALYVFSGSIPNLAAGKCYDLFGAFARLEHRGDFAAAAKALGAMGFGTPRNGKHHANGKAVRKDEAPAADAPPEPPPWEDPIPLDTGVKVPSFPLETLPKLLGDLVKAVAAATSSPPDYVAVTSLGIAAGVLGATRALDVKDRYAELSSLYVCIVAPKGSGKTPAASYLMAPLVAEQSRRRIDGDKTRAFVENVTVEKMADMLQKSPRGLLMVRDEISGLFGGFNQYKAKGQGSDRQFYLSCWSGAPITVDRKDPLADPVFVAHPCLSITGGIQPSVLSRYTSDSDDGLFDRFLFAFPDPLPMAAETGLTVPRGLMDEWSDAITRLWRIPMVSSDGGDRPYFLRLSQPGWEEWIDWTKWLAAQVNADDFPDELRGPAAKLRGYAARLALVCHALDEAYLESAPTTVLGGDDMARGAALAKYFFGHARRVWTASGRDERVAAGRRILNWIRGWPNPTFTRRDIWRGLRKSFARIEDLIQPLRWLVQLGHIRYVGQPADRSARGIQTTVYETHPMYSSNSGQGDMGDMGDNCPAARPRVVRA